MCVVTKLQAHGYFFGILTCLYDGCVYTVKNLKIFIVFLLFQLFFFTPFGKTTWVFCTGSVEIIYCL